MAENNPAEIPRTTLPRYAREAAELALQLATLTTEELERMLRTNRQIAATNRRRYRQFHGEEALPALLAYTGVVFRHIAPERFTPGDFEYAQQHLNITSFLYGLLRPLDANSAGFVLSFSAMGAILLLAPGWQRWAERRWPEARCH